MGLYFDKQQRSPAAWRYSPSDAHVPAGVVGEVAAAAAAAEAVARLGGVAAGARTRLRCVNRHSLGLARVRTRGAVVVVARLDVLMLPRQERLFSVTTRHALVLRQTRAAGSGERDAVWSPLRSTIILTVRHAPF